MLAFEANWGLSKVYFRGEKLSSLTLNSTTSFPGSLFLPPGASEERPWLGLVTCPTEIKYIVEGRSTLAGILSILSLRECEICCHQNKPGKDQKFSQRGGKRNHHLIVEIQVAVGCVVWFS